MSLRDVFGVPRPLAALAIVLAALLSLSMAGNVDAAFLNLTDQNISGTPGYLSTHLQYAAENGVAGDFSSASGGYFRFSRDQQGSSGTGVINPFLRIQDSPNEEGFNHDGSNQILDETVSQTNSLAINTVPSYTLSGGGPATEFREFLLDVNEPGGVNGQLISLNQVQVFAATSAYATNPNLTHNGITTTGNGTRIISFADNPLTAGADFVEIFRLSDQAIQHQIMINGTLAGAGSGTYNAIFFLDNSLFSSLSSQYTHLIFYSHFGAPPGGQASESGFEEWSISRFATIPEPRASMLMALIAMFPIGRHLKRRFLPAKSDPS